MRTFELTDQEFETLLLALGTATGAALRHSDNGMAYSFLRLANAINKDNPKWTPYVIPEEEQQHA